MRIARFRLLKVIIFSLLLSNGNFNTAFSNYLTKNFALNFSEGKQEEEFFPWIKQFF
jgi:hypothetical protein